MRLHNIKNIPRLREIKTLEIETAQSLSSHINSRFNKITNTNDKICKETDNENNKERTNLDRSCEKWVPVIETWMLSSLPRFNRELLIRGHLHFGVSRTGPPGFGGADRLESYLPRPSPK